MEGTDLDRWRSGIRQWLERNVSTAPPPYTGGALADGQRAWERTLYEAGLAAIHWPEQYGGRDASLTMRTVYQEEYERSGAPPRLNWGALTIAGPALMRFGTVSQRDRWLVPMLRCDEIWCQGFSEPEAGSDLANLRTKAVRHGDQFVVNGQKIWTSNAEIADWMFALVRTGTSGGGHDGITFLMIDMTSPGIEVRPIRQMAGNQGFAEVFFTDVGVAAEHVVGEVGGGWRVAMASLALERAAGRRTYVKFLRDLSQVREFAIRRGRGDDPVTRERLGHLLSRVLAYKHFVDLSCNASDAPARPALPSVNKLYWADMELDIYETGLELLGDGAGADDLGLPPGSSQRWVDDYWYARAAQIFAGTTQIQLNLVAEGMLGLPKERRW